MPTILMPLAELESRDSDVRLPSSEQFLKLSFFARLKRKPGVDRFPGTLILRRFQKGEVICRQGEAGWTAFYILTAEDVLAVLQALLAAEPGAGQQLEQAVAHAQAGVQELQGKAPTDPERRAATVHLALARRPEPGEKGFLHSLRRTVLGLSRRTTRNQPLYIPIDAPTDVSYESRQAPLYEGDLFGEMSCMYGTPRSATIVADRDCFVLEMLRNILDQAQKDEGYRAHMDRLYKERVLQIHLRRLSIFNDLTDEQFAAIRDGLELVRYEAGELICDENEPADCMYLVRSGIVKVVKNVSALLAAADVTDWKALWTRLREGEQQAAGGQHSVWQRLPEPVRDLVGRTADPSTLTADEQTSITQALNALITDEKLAAAAEMQAVATQAGLTRPTVPAKREQWSGQDVQKVRRANRLLLQAIFAGALRPLPPEGGPENILSYAARGDFLGEMGLMMRQPRTATCVAYVHPEPNTAHQAQGIAPWRRDGSDRVELVRISEKLFWQLLENSPAVRQKVEVAVARRQKENVARLRLPAWDEGPQPLLSERFEELGLIQGQKLMLIDLDRCTRCDECVRACVATHDDHRSRLFLDGPRFGKYLVPTTCRSCLDPVCLVGCPVGSIHRGDNRQIIIEDWCIGCGLCANNCPYGSIQMHDIGVIASGARGWRYQAASACTGTAWTQPGFRDGGWPLRQAPFRRDDSLQVAEEALCGRYAFEVGADVLRSANEFQLEVTSTDANAQVWVNGQEIQTKERIKQGKRRFTIPTTEKVLRPGRNVVALKAALKAGETLDVRLDAVRAPVGAASDVSEKLVQELAVVCDLCSNQYGRRPACVTACPHDAAIRVDARFEFPAGS